MSDFETRDSLVGTYQRFFFFVFSVTCIMLNYFIQIHVIWHYKWQKSHSLIMSIDLLSLVLYLVGHSAQIVAVCPWITMGLPRIFWTSSSNNITSLWFIINGQLKHSDLNARVYPFSVNVDNQLNLRFNIYIYIYYATALKSSAKRVGISIN